jgi:FMN-dependent NADH-azoreductase
MNLLHIDSSILGEASASRTLTREIVERLKSARPDTRVTYLDLAADELAHFSPRSLARTDERAAARDEQALEQFLAADVVVIGAPMYNFSIPSQLKAWIDRIVIKGRTFRYGPKGPEGLAGDKQVIVAIARGGIYPDGAASGDFGESYLKHLFGFLGVRDLTFVRAEGLNISPQHRTRGIEAARAAIPLPAALAA